MRCRQTNSEEGVAFADSSVWLSASAFPLSAAEQLTGAQAAEPIKFLAAVTGGGAGGRPVGGKTLQRGAAGAPAGWSLGSAKPPIPGWACTTCRWTEIYAAPTQSMADFKSKQKVHTSQDQVIKRPEKARTSRDGGRIYFLLVFQHWDKNVMVEVFF